MDIREKTRKEITTPGGYKVIIRKLNLFSFMETGTIPDVLAPGKKISDKALMEHMQRDSSSLRQILKLSLTEGVVGGDLDIVDKRPKECEGEELSYQEVPQDDAVFIINSVLDFSDMSGGVAVDKAQPFSKKKK